MGVAGSTRDALLAQRHLADRRCAPSYAVMSTVVPVVDELLLSVDDVDVLVDAVLELILPP